MDDLVEVWWSGDDCLMRKLDCDTVTSCLRSLGLGAPSVPSDLGMSLSHVYFLLYLETRSSMAV